MPRPNKLWYRTARQCWYCTIDGQTHKLGPDRDKAETRFHELMASRGQQVPYVDNDRYLNHVFQAYLDWLSENREGRTRELVLMFLSSLDERYPQMLVSHLRPYHVDAWAREHATWNETTKATGIAKVVSALYWAKRQGMIDVNPIAGMNRPARRARVGHVTEEELQVILQHSDRPFRDLLTVSYDTGARPQEVKALEARHIDADFERAVFPAEESKGKRRPRAVYIGSERSKAILRRLAEKHPEGKLFRNRRGTPWSRSSVASRFQTLAKHLGRKVRQYDFRHEWITRSLKSGLDSHTVAALAGHVDSSMIDAVYSHIRDDKAYMSAQAKRVK